VLLGDKVSDSVGGVVLTNELGMDDGTRVATGTGGCVGSILGLLVILRVGLPDGFAVLTMVGMSVIVTVGASVVCTIVGVLVGCIVIPEVGNGEGALVLTAEGSKVGEPVVIGVEVGSRVGDTVGDLVGEAETGRVGCVVGELVVAAGVGKADGLAVCGILVGELVGNMEIDSNDIDSVSSCTILNMFLSSIPIHARKALSLKTYGRIAPSLLSNSLLLSTPPLRIRRTLSAPAVGILGIIM
jgi:hypothetical protein